MNSLNEHELNTINVLLYVLKKIGGQGDFHLVFKIMYFAEQKHLAKYGVSITPEDYYVKMEFGPVPSVAYDILKTIRYKNSIFKEELSHYFKLVYNDYTVEAIAEPDMDYLSESEVCALDESIRENRDLDFRDRTDKSHDNAYNKAQLHGEIHLLDIAKGGGASDGMLEYIIEHNENTQAKFQ